MTSAMIRHVQVLVFAVAAAGCGSSDDEAPRRPVVVTPAPEGAPWETLEEWHLFSNAPKQKPAERVTPFEVISPLWSDGAFKRRFAFVPEGATVGYDATGRWAFPVGTVLVKTFSYFADAQNPASAERLLETRLLVHESAGWTAHTYVWDDAQQAAVRTVAGVTLPVEFIDDGGQSVAFDYGVPNTNQCAECHGKNPDTLGGKTRQLDREHDYGKGAENQIDHFAALGWFASPPPPAAERERLVAPAGSAPVAERARSYLDANCSQCHSAGGSASQSGLLLSWFDTAPGADQTTWGVCKVPTSAGGATCGLTHDIVPGNPDQSILVCRVESRDPQVQMPPLATKRVDEQGVALIREWISGLTPTACP